MAKTHTRADLIEAVHNAVGLSRQDSSQIIESVLETVGARLQAGESVKLSSFGTFHVRDKNERIGRNPKTGEQVAITPRRVLTFRASNVLKDRVNNGCHAAHKAS